MPPDVTPETALPYEKQPDEPPKHYEWFCAFLEMGPGRSLLGAQKNFQQRSGKVWKGLDATPSWKNAAQKWNWKARARIWDREQREERMKAIAERERAMIDRIFAKINTQLERVDLIEGFAEFVMKYPRTNKKTVDGKTVIEPGEWTFDTGIRAFLAANKANADAATLLDLLSKIERNRAAREIGTDVEVQLMEARLLLESHGISVGEARDEATLSPTEQRRAQENAQLDELETIAREELRAGIAGASERMLRISQRRAALNGLDMPTKIAQTDVSGENLPPWVSELLNASPDELQLRRAELDARRRAAMADAGESAQPATDEL